MENKRRKFSGPFTDGVGRHLFGVGEGPAEAVAGAKRESMGLMRKQFARKLVIKQWMLRRRPSDNGRDDAAPGRG